jgi:2-C-methyl-D-erythritol 4-phosphate cytidylyltransferase/2-C-methyl-D-erythritol 2,4-cyclodiphosphate synthase
MHCAGLVVAGGRGTRFGGRLPKQYLPLAGRPLLAWTLDAFQRCPAVQSLVLVVAEDWLQQARELLATTPPDRIVAGGHRRSDSVLAGLRALPPEAQLVAIHDGARPLVTPQLIERVVRAAARHGAALPALPVPDTLKRGHQQQVQGTVDRVGLHLAQTPQTFAVELIRRAHEEHLRRQDQGGGLRVTDDAQLVERLGQQPRLVTGDPANIKITTPADLELAEGLLRARGDGGGPGPPRVGQGFDAHRLVPGRGLVLGGVAIPWERGLLGHSDADVLCHAVGDALLGAAALGDLGSHFSDSDPGHRDANSLDLLARVRQLLQQAGFEPLNVDATVVCQRPRLDPHREAMRANLARVLGLPPERVNVKATTTEGLGPAGRGEGIEARAVAMIRVQ